MAGLLAVARTGLPAGFTAVRPPRVEEDLRRRNIRTGDGEIRVSAPENLLGPARPLC